MADRAGGAWLKLATVAATVLASAIANAMAAQAAVARILFAMARDRKLPAVLAKVNPRFKTPYVGTPAVAGTSGLVGACCIAIGATYYGVLTLRGRRPIGAVSGENA